MSKVGSYDTFEYLQYKLWLKKKVGNQNVNFIPDH